MIDGSLGPFRCDLCGSWTLDQVFHEEVSQAHAEAVLAAGGPAAAGGRRPATLDGWGEAMPAPGDE